MTGESRPRVSLPLVLLLGCGLPTAPNPGTHYVLVTINGRSMPTWVTPPGAQDSVYGVILGEEFDVISTTQMTWFKSVGTANRHADGTFTYFARGCWQVTVEYRQRHDTLTLFPGSASPDVPTPPILLVDGSDLVQRTVTSVELRYVPARPLTITC